MQTSTHTGGNDDNDEAGHCLTEESHRRLLGSQTTLPSNNN